MIFTVSQRVEDFAISMGVGNQLPDYLRRAAIVSHPDGNRRFHTWIFQVDGQKVVKMTDLRTGRSSDPKRDLKLGPKEFLVYEECEGCSGAGCGKCGGSGEVRVVRSLK